MASKQTVNSSTDPFAVVTCASGNLLEAGWCSEEAMMPSGRIPNISSCWKHMLAVRPAIEPFRYPVPAVARSPSMRPTATDGASLVWWRIRGWRVAMPISGSDGAYPARLVKSLATVYFA